MTLFYTPDIVRSQELPSEEAAHCARVLRMTEGERILLTDGAGAFYEAELTLVSNKRCLFKVVETRRPEPLWTGHLHVAMAPTKHMDRTEWFAEKATEIGLDELTFLNCRYSERKVIKTERVDKILVSAMKQSLKASKPVLNEMTDFAKFVAQPFGGQKFICHCYGDLGEKIPLMKALHPGDDAVVMVGPEGDFSREEVELAVKHGFRPVSLGRSRLRTETAALAACHILNLFNQK